MQERRKAKRQQNFFDTCSQCKTQWSCCHETTPPITPHRRKVIEAFLSENGINISNPFTRTEYIFPRLCEDGYCVFHDKKTRKCIVHSVKPETCVAGPITFDVDPKTEKPVWFIKKESICPLASRVYEDKVLLKKHMESAEKEILELLVGLNSFELAAILKKDEPETFKIQ